MKRRTKQMLFFLVLACNFLILRFDLIGSLSWWVTSHSLYKQSEPKLPEEVILDGIYLKPVLRISTVIEQNKNPIGPYQDVFQTDPLNNGIRFEIGVDGQASLIFKSNVAVGYEVCPVNVKGLYSPLKIDVFSIKDKSLVFSINGKKICESSGKPSWSGQDIVLGYGFDMSRKFEGDIRSAQIEIGEYNPYVFTDSILKVLLLVFDLIAVGYIKIKKTE